MIKNILKNLLIKKNKQRKMDIAQKKQLLQKYALPKQSIKSENYTSEILNDNMKVKNLAKEGDIGKTDILKVKGTDFIDKTGDKTPLTKIDDFTDMLKKNSQNSQLKATFADALKRGDTDMISKLNMIAKKTSKGLKMIPVLGTAISLAMNPNDASASVPILDSAEETGPKKGSLDSILEDPNASYEERENAYKKLILQNMVNNKGN